MADVGRKMTWEELAEENARLKSEISVCIQAVEGTLPAANHVDFQEGHPQWSPLAQAIVSLRQDAAAAIFMANQRNNRARKFMEPEALAEAFHKVYVELILETEGITALPWEELPLSVVNQSITIARQISLAHAKAMNGPGTEEDPAVLKILEEGATLTRAIELLATLKDEGAYRELERLDSFLRKHFPKQSVAQGDAAMDAVRRAEEILILMHTYAPMAVKALWDGLVRPALHTLQAYGIEVLPPGTIIYGAKPNRNVHRPE